MSKNTTEIEFFIGRTEEEAMKNHELFLKPINSIAKTYAIKSGIDKKELVNEGFIALHKAVMNFDETKGKFYPYAIRCIKYHIIDVLRKNNPVYIPSYVVRATNIINGIKRNNDEHILSLIEKFCAKEQGIDDKAYESLKTLHKLSNRVNVSLFELVNRTFYNNPPDTVDDSYHETYNLLELCEEDITILSWIAKGLNKQEIASSLQKSVSWVDKRLKIIKNMLKG